MAHIGSIRATLLVSKQGMIPYFKGLLVTLITAVYNAEKSPTGQMHSAAYFHSHSDSDPRSYSCNQSLRREERVCMRMRRETVEESESETKSLCKSKAAAAAWP